MHINNININNINIINIDINKVNIASLLMHIIAHKKDKQKLNVALTDHNQPPTQTRTFIFSFQIDQNSSVDFEFSYLWRWHAATREEIPSIYKI